MTETADRPAPGEGAPTGDALFAWDALGPAEPIDPRPRLSPLTARSVMLSVMLGSSRPALPVRSLVRAAQLFGISEGTARVALSRMSADGDVTAESGRYHLSDRLLQRQRRVDRDVDPDLTDWDGSWELGIALPPVQTASERASLRAQMKRLHLTELRPGVFARPQNLAREWPDTVTAKFARFRATPAFPADQMPVFVGCLWDISGFESAGRYLLDRLGTATEPAERFLVAAAITRLLREDPVLPAELLPPTWPGGELREAFRAYGRELDALLQQESVFGS